MDDAKQKCEGAQSYLATMLQREEGLMQVNSSIITFHISQD